MSLKISKFESCHSRRIMAVTFIMVGVVVLLFHGVIQDYAHGLFESDGIYIPNQTYKFLDQDRGHILSHTFRIYNLRPRRLAVRVEPDCGCTSLSWRNKIIAPFSWQNFTATMRMPESAKPSDERTVIGITVHTDSRAKSLMFAFLVA